MNAIPDYIVESFEAGAARCFFRRRTNLPLRSAPLISMKKDETDVLA